MKIDFKNKTVWVVGASSGIGEGLIKQLAKENCNIILSARRENKLKNIQTSLKLSNKNSLVLPLDISKSNEFDNKIALVISKFLSIDILILNSGIAHKSFAEETLEEVDRRIMEVNFMGNILLTKFFNVVYSTNFTDCHTGLWIYNLKHVKKNIISSLTDTFNFDNQMRINLVKKKLEIKEIPILTIYGNERSSVHLIYALKFFFETILKKIT